MVRIARRGNALCIVVPKALLERLGWNLHDMVRVDVIGTALTAVRVELPPIPDLRKVFSDKSPSS